MCAQLTERAGHLRNETRGSASLRTPLSACASVQKTRIGGSLAPRDAFFEYPAWAGLAVPYAAINTFGTIRTLRRGRVENLTGFGDGHES